MSLRIKIFVPLVLIAISLHAQTGEIRGKVVDELNSTVDLATVSVVPVGAVLSKAIKTAQSGPGGGFTIIAVPLGRYRVFASKESEGYPRTNFAFYNTHPLIEVTVSERQPVATVVVKVGPKAGIILAKVTDAISGKELDATFELRSVDNPKNFFGITTQRPYKLLVPSGRAITMQVGAQGHKTRTYPKSILLKPHQELILDIKLDPLER